MKRARIREGKGASAVGLLAGLVFLFIGITVIIPAAGTFGIFWTLIVLVIIGASAYNLFSQRGLSVYEVDVDSPSTAATEAGDFDARLRKLARLKADGLITEDEYEHKRAEIMSQRW